MNTDAAVTLYLTVPTCTTERIAIPSNVMPHFIVFKHMFEDVLVDSTVTEFTQCVTVPGITIPDLRFVVDMVLKHEDDLGAALEYIKAHKTSGLTHPAEQLTNLQMKEMSPDQLREIMPSQFGGVTDEVILGLGLDSLEHKRIGAIQEHCISVAESALKRLPGSEHDAAEPGRDAAVRMLEDMCQFLNAATGDLWQNLSGRGYIKGLSVYDLNSYNPTNTQLRVTLAAATRILRICDYLDCEVVMSVAALAIGRLHANAIHRFSSPAKALLAITLGDGTPEDVARVAELQKRHEESIAMAGTSAENITKDHLCHIVEKSIASTAPPAVLKSRAQEIVQFMRGDILEE